MADELIVPVSKWRPSLVLLCSLVFIGVFLSLLMYPAAIRDNFWITIVAAVLGLAFFGLGAVISARQVFDRRPALILTADKLIDNSAVLQIPEILWSEVAYAEIVPNMNQRFLIVHLRDPEAVLARQSAAVQSVQTANMSLFGSPVIIAGSILSTPVEDVLAFIQARLTGPSLGTEPHP